MKVGREQPTTWMGEETGGRSYDINENCFSREKQSRIEYIKLRIIYYIVSDKFDVHAWNINFRFAKILFRYFVQSMAIKK